MSNIINQIKFHHFGVAVNNFRTNTNFYKSLGYEISEIVIDPLQKVELKFCSSEKFPDVELIKPISNRSPVISYVKPNQGNIYHICYEVNNIKTDIKRIINNHRAHCVSEPKPAILFNSRLVAFYYIHGIGLVEVLENDFNR